MDFYKLSSILQEALKNIDEEKLYTKHIFDRFDADALITTLVRSASYIAILIAQTYVFKVCQNKIQLNQSKFILSVFVSYSFAFREEVTH